MLPSDDDVREMVRRILNRMLEPSSDARTGVRADAQPLTAAAPGRTGSKLVDEAAVRSLAPGTTFVLPEGALITPLARQAALDRGITLREPSLTTAVQPDGRERRVPVQRRVAIGADHGGYALKEALKPHLGSLGYDVVDCGTHGTDPVDYPDIAYAVACLVAEGSCAAGIIVDGAGIGSCMAANKVPGVRAALCYDHATAVNSREHNHANVLTLGAGLIGASLAKQIVTDWLATPYGPDRHAKRVAKIMAIEKRYTRTKTQNSRESEHASQSGQLQP